jgi:Ca2+-transporting ATPase
MIVMLVYVGATAYGRDENQARTMAFTALVIANLCLILSIRSWTDTLVDSVRRSNRALWYVSGGAVVFLAAALYIPALQGVFLFAPLSVPATVASVAVGLSSLVLFEAAKVIYKAL